MNISDFKKQDFTYRVDQRILRLIKALGPADQEPDELLINEETGTINEVQTQSELDTHLRERIKDIVREVLDETVGQLSEIIEEIKKAKPVTIIAKADKDDKKHTLCYDPSAQPNTPGYIVNPIYVYSNFDPKLNLDLERGEDKKITSKLADLEE